MNRLPPELVGSEKAKRNAIIQMLTSSGNPMEAMDEEELADEAMESQIVQEAKA